VSGRDEEAPDRVVAGRYQLDHVLGRGGMGTVWLAVDTLIERKVALKELRAPQGTTEEDAAAFVERALREARNAGRLNHPGVVGVHDVIAPAGGDDAVYLVMEYVMAPSLMELIDDEGPLPASRVAALGLGILDAVAAAHTMGIVHRDIKPGNVLVREGDRVKLTDFGIALAAEDTRLTRTGVVGTHAYLAPECFDTGGSGPAADLWALGATLFHAVAGNAPFDRPTTTATLRAILFEDAPPPPCGPPLADVITGLLTRQVDERLGVEAARELLQRAADEPAPAPPPADGPPAGGSGWAAQATGLHRPPATPSPGIPTGGPAAPAAASWGQQTQPAGPPHGSTTGSGGQAWGQATRSPAASWGQTNQPVTNAPAWGQTNQAGGSSAYGSGQPSAPAAPAPGSGGYAGSGGSNGRGHSPAGGSWAGQSQRNPNTSWIVGGAVAVLAVLLVVVLIAAGGGSDDDSGGGGSGGAAGSGGATEVVDGPGPAADQDPDGAATGLSLAQDFLDTLMGGDADGAAAMLCPVGDNQDEVDNIGDVAGDADLQVDAATSEIVDDVVYSVDLTGSVHGQAITYGHVGTAFEDGCVVSFGAISS
jgi:tRNA A-37 threonylcarbamoyl transferase component Bud32